jgi:hypothetical protein
VFSILVDDESIGGYQLRWGNTILPKVRVGDMLGIRPKNTPVGYILGIVRWLRYFDDDDLRLGIQIISPSCHSATLISSEKTSSSSKNHYRCLLLSGKGVNNIQAGLICDTREFELNTVLTLVTDSGSQQIMLTDWLESNNRFIHYQFKYLEDAQTPEKIV